MTGDIASVPLVSEGISTVSFHGADNAGNVEPVHTLTVKLDKKPPTITGGADSRAQWRWVEQHARDRRLGCSDALSGPEGASTTTSTVTAERADQTIRRSVCRSGWK